MNVLDLFSGIGGFSLGLERAGMTTVAFCEVDPWCRKILAKHWPDVPCFDDVRTLKGDDVGSVQLICGGFPCQPFSQAGLRRGAEDDRHLWPEMFRIIKDIRPRWVIGENVAGHISMGLDDVLSDLEGEGYTCWPIVIPACAVDAPHRRDRVWIVADASQQFSDGRNNNGRGRPGQTSEFRNGVEESGPVCCRWLSESGVGRVAHGIPRRVDRLKGLGNAVVPQIPEMIGRAIMAVGT
ncbi:MAG: DNA (cytosine-5-)-methyltransferase [Alphaproteobacteria bacterium]|jgi:DNA (cytosine-5)-methyltransferase 1|nr:DNA (cytosine-5-)-methyltransferase [Alphaproteobacteria bacterium]